jgi:hypothetical protein
MSEKRVMLTIYSSDRGVTSKLVDREDGGYRAGESSKEFEDGSKLVYEGNRIQKDLGVTEIVEFSLYLGKTAIEGYAVHHLINKLEGTDFRLTVNGEEVEADEEALQTKLEEFEE